ncbi:MAG TPA: glucose-1-phosphate cytidylyltransferase [Chromatiales bacterium]|nr:glucose-1-phosphate cytidylyltransferase [Chromatiales bacterium]
MKVVLFCGGLGTRLREHSETIPKPLVNIGPRPIIWNLMRYYAYHGHKDFILCLGYGGEKIKEYFLNYNECLSNDFVLSDGGKEIRLHNSDIHDWTITFADTGQQSNIGERLVAARKYLEGEEIFLANYSDGLTDLPLAPYIDKFKESEALACFLSVRPSQSFHAVDVAEDGLVSGIEHVGMADFWINGGFFVLRQEIFDYINDGEELVEEPFQRLIEEKKLMSHKYEEFWAAMDTFKDKKRFDSMYDKGDTPWRVWDGLADV